MQRLKRTLKKIAAISSGVVMLGATALGAVAAADLSAYPAPFVADGKWSGLIVVGTGGTNPAGLASDIAGAVDIAARLAQEATTSTGTSTTIAGGEEADIILGTALATAGGGTNNIKATLKANDVAGLADTSITWDDGDGSDVYDIKEQITLGLTNLKTVISADSNHDYEANPVIQLGKGDIKYYYMFMDAINLSKIGTDNPLMMTFLGKDVKITSTSDADTIVAEIGTEYYMTVGDSVEVEGKTVTLKDVSSGSTATVVVDVGGTTEVVSTTAKTVNGLKLLARQAFYSDTKTDRSATILVGTETSKSYNDGDPYTGQNKDDPDWVWTIAGAHDYDAATTVGSINSIGIKWDQAYNDPNDPVLKVGDCISAPNTYFSLCFDSLTVNDWVDYTIDFDTSVDVSDATGYSATAWESKYALVLSTVDDEGFLTGSYSTDTIYLIVNQSDTAAEIDVFYRDTDSGDYALSKSILPAAGTTNVGYITYKDTSRNITITKPANMSNAYFNISIADYNNNIDVRMLTSTAAGVTSIANLGPTASTSEASELAYGTYGIGTVDNDLMTEYGIIIKNPDSNGANDQVKLQIPADQVYANVVVKGTGTTTATSGTAVTINSIAGVPLVKLDTEVTDKTSKPLILMGGPAVNSLSAQALGVAYPSYNEASTIPQNKALIKLVENAFGGTNVALVVAGWSASNTREAANVLKDYASYDLSGKAVEVSGTTVTAVTSTTTTA